MPSSRRKRPRAILQPRTRPLGVPVPLSLAQRGLWIMHQMDPSDTSYHTLLAVRLLGTADVPSLERALAEVVDRHEILRTSFPASPDGEPYQRVHDPSHVSIAHHDVSASSDPQAAARSLVERYQLEPYDVTESPPVRCAVITVSAAEVIVVVGAHHLVSDAVSGAVLLRDIDQCYRRVGGDVEEALPPLPVQYADFALYQQERVDGGELGRALERWNQRLQGFDHRFDPRHLSPVEGGWGVDAGVAIDLPPEATAQFRNVASSVNATPFMLVFAVWALVNSQLDPQANDDVIIGVPVDGRDAKAVRDLVGLFVTMVPVRVSIDTRLTVTEFLSTVRDKLLEAYADADVPLEWIVRSLAPRRTSDRVPLLEVSCQLQHSGGDHPTIGAMPAQPLAPAPQKAKFQLSLNAVMSPAGTRLHISYPRDRFPHGAVEALGEHLRDTLTRIIRDPAVPLSELPVFAAVKPQSSGDRGAPPSVASPRVPATTATTDDVSEQDIAALFAEVIGRQNVAPTDDFFDLGGHSLLALHLMRRLRERHGDGLPFNSVFAHPTARALASAIAAVASPDALPPIEDIRQDVGLWLGPLPEPSDGISATALITGVTGLMGAHVLAEILETTSITPWCLVRARGNESRQLRVESALRGIGRWQLGWHDRIRVLSGELSSPRMGLSECDYAEAASRVDTIFHVAAVTHLVDSYTNLRPPNVRGTKEVLWFATTGRLKSVHYISTVSSMRADVDSPELLPENWHTDPALLPEDGYVRSKWVAEETVRQAGRLGVPTAIYRPSRISGGVAGRSMPGSDAFWNFVVACIEMGAEPEGEEWAGFRDRLVPADYLAAAVVHIAMAEEADGTAYNLINPVPTSLAEVLDAARSLGYHIRRVPGDAWLHSLKEAVSTPRRHSRALDAALLLTETVLRQRPRFSRDVSTAEADAALEGTEISCPVIDGPLLRTYLSALTEAGNLSAPSTARDVGDSESAAASVWDLWERAVKRWPRRPAARGEDETVTFEELDSRAAVMAAGLAARGVAHGDRVGIRLRHDVSLLATLLAVIRLGATFVPVDHRQEDERSRGLLRRARVSLTVAEPDSCDDSSTVDPGKLLRDGRDLPTPTPVAAGVAYVLFTSGSTGEPKGVVVPHGALARYLEWVRDEYVGPGSDGAPLYSSLAFDLTITSLFGPLVSGGTVHLVDPQDGIIRVAEMLDDGASFDFVKLTPTHLRLLLAQVDGRPLRGHVAALVLGGEALHAALIEAWRTLSPRTVIYNEYGPTEATVGCCVHRLDIEEEVPRPVPIGVPMPGVHLRIVDDDGTDVPAGEIGELAIGGCSLAWGYDGNTHETARRFVPDDRAGQFGERSYLTGDLVRLRNDGALMYQGRSDHQVKIRGHRVEMDEVAATLRGLDGVRDCAVRSFTNGVGDVQLVAYVVCVGITGSATDEFRARARLRLPDYMVPGDFVIVDQIPTTMNGKVDFAALPDPPRPQ